MQDETRMKVIDSYNKDLYRQMMRPFLPDDVILYVTLSISIPPFLSVGVSHKIRKPKRNHSPSSLFWC